MTHDTTLEAIIGNNEDRILSDWMAETEEGTRLSDTERRSAEKEARTLLQAMREALAGGASMGRFDEPSWGNVRRVLEGLSRARVAQGQSAGDTSMFVLGLKRPLFRLLAGGADRMDEVLAVSGIADKMAQWTVATYQQTREELIKRQQEELLELSTPVIKLWDGVLAVPMIGTLDSNRTQVVMETLLERIVETGSTLAIIDITGVPTVDTLVAQHLLKTVSAIRLMGAECIISGIRPQIAQTIVHLGIDLQGVASKATLADALALALRQRGYVINRTQ
jgi:rsbT co-antagonist protein RsbR